MARALRIHVADGWYHVVSRGSGGRAIYRDDDDRRRFLDLVSELPERFGVEIHAFVLMDNHYHLLVRCRRTSLSETLRWMQTSYAVHFNLAHRRRGPVFQGRFKGILIRDETALDGVARYMHLNPVRMGGLGLSRDDQRRAKELGCPDPGAELVARRIAVLRGHRWSSWPMYAGLEAAPGWLTTDRIRGGCGGRRPAEQRAALVRYTETPIHQGHLEGPWTGVVGGVVLGEVRDAKALIRRAAKQPGKGQFEMGKDARRVRPPWKEIVRAAEKILGRTWREMSEEYGDWGRDGVMAVATGHLGWRLVEVAREVPDVAYDSLAQGVRRFRRLSANRPEMEGFAVSLRNKFSKLRD
jgi:REP element-mobilizing transposase RayT